MLILNNLILNVAKMLSIRRFDIKRKTRSFMTGILLIATLPLSLAHTKHKRQEQRQIRTNCSPLANYSGQATSP